MRIAIAYKWAPSPQDAVVAPDGAIDWPRARPAISEYDPVAIEVARRLADSFGCELVGVSIGARDVASSLARKAGLSRGLDRTVIVADEDLADAGSTLTGQVIATVVRRLGDVGLILTGDSSVDVGAHLVPATLAGSLGWPAVVDVVAVSGAPGELELVQAVGAGTRRLRVSGPAVLAVTSDAAVPRVPGMKDILAAGKKPVEELSLADLDLPARAADPARRYVRGLEPPARARRVIAGTDPNAAAAEVVAALRAGSIIGRGATA